MAEEKKEKKGFFAEFREFISRGNVMDMAVGIIVGSAFTKIVNSLVADVINPVVGFVIGGVNFSDLAITLREADEAAGIAAVTVKYGQFVQNIVDFLIVAFVVFVLVRSVNRIRRLGEKAKTDKQEKEIK